MSDEVKVKEFLQSIYDVPFINKLKQSEATTLGSSMLSLQMHLINRFVKFLGNCEAFV